MFHVSWVVVLDNVGLLFRVGLLPAVIDPFAFAVFRHERVSAKVFVAGWGVKAHSFIRCVCSGSDRVFPSFLLSRMHS